ncbi:MAG: hypothetical protein DCC58_10845 [Chloroflexi bacterium]|nr:MAG: hypothetical protein DCC58_10845 [Chloroflexota bacterium]
MAGSEEWIALFVGAAGLFLRSVRQHLPDLLHVQRSAVDLLHDGGVFVVDGSACGGLWRLSDVGEDREPVRSV